MANIDKELNEIKNAIYGKDVRGAIHDGIEKVYNDATKYSGEKDMEVVLARGSHSNLNDRLNKTDQQLAETAQEIQSLESQKMDKSTSDISVSQINKNKGKLDQTYMTDGFLQQMAGSTPINALPADDSITTDKLADKSVTPGKASFVKTTRNLFDGSYLKGGLRKKVGTEELEYALIESIGSPIALIPIDPGTYTIKRHEPESGRLNIAIMNNEPVIGGSYQLVDTTILISDNQKEYTFENVNGSYLMITPSLSGEPKMQVEKSANPTEYVPPFELDDYKVSLGKNDVGINDLNFAEESSKNLFDGIYSNAALRINSSGLPGYRSGTEGENTAIVSVSPLKTYTIKIHEPQKKNRFVVLGSTSLPTSSSWGELDYGFTNDDSLTQITIETPEDMNYLLVYVSNLGETPLLQVEEGSEATPYLSSKYIPRKYLDLPLMETKNEPDKQTTERKFYLYTSTPKKYERPVDLESPRTFVQRLTHEDIYGRYDDLMNAFPEYITKTLLGYASNSSGDEDVNTPIYEYALRPRTGDLDFNSTNNDDILPTILIQSGLHGNEKLAVWTTYTLIKNICEGSDPFNTFFRYNVELRVVPLANPGGFNLNTRNNPNDVNLNRNFEINWTDTQQHPGPYPLSELESQILDGWYRDMKEKAITFIDVHNITGIHETSQGRYGFVWIIARDKTIKLMSLNMLSELSLKWLNEIESFSDFPRDSILGEVSDYQSGMSIEQAYEIHGIKSVVSDPERTAITYYPEMEVNGLELFKINIDTLGSLLLGIAKNLIK